MKMLDYEMKKTDDLLYRMIPKPVAKRLRKGEPAVNTCEVRSTPATTSEGQIKAQSCPPATHLVMAELTH